MDRSLACWMCSVLLVGSPALGEQPDQPEVGDQPAKKYALLVGCSQYSKNHQIPELWGPSNDVAVIAETLSTRLGFPKASITILSEHDERASRKPTSDNIRREFETLIKQAAGSYIFILMNGHGTQLPVEDDPADKFDPVAEEQDGLDEVFLPSDVGDWNGDDLAGALRDNQIAEWLDKMKQQGGHVWIVFDCCHSGTMTRSIDLIAGEERSRGLDPTRLGVPDKLLEAAQKKAQTAERSRSVRRASELPFDANQLSESEGSVVAFFAAQPFETAPELPRPSDAPRTRKHYYGLFSYSLAQILRQSHGRLTYRDLARRLLNLYRAERGSRAPTPLFSGNLDQHVLGRTFEHVPVYLEHTPEGPRLSAGALAGLTAGTILAVYPAAGSTERKDQILGYVKVVHAAPSFAELVSWRHVPTQAAVPLTQFPAESRCVVVEQALGDLRVGVAVVSETEGDRSLVETALSKLPSRVASLVRIIDNPADAQWLLRTVTPDEARQDFDVEIEEPKLFLLTASGQAGLTRGEEFAQPRAATMAKVYQQYKLGSAATLSKVLSRDLRKIFAWQNVWRVATKVGDVEQATEPYVTFEVFNREQTTPDGALQPASHSLHPGQRIELRLKNNSLSDQWVALLYLDANYGISTWYSGSIKGGQRLRPFRVRIDDRSFGAEGFVVMSVPLGVQKLQPDYSFLEQPPLGEAARDVSLPAPKTPFERLMVSVTSLSESRTRNAVKEEPTNPQIEIWTWTTVQD